MNIGPVTRHDHAREVEFHLPHPENKLPVVVIEPAALLAIFDHAAEGFPVEIGGYYLGLPLVDTASRTKVTYIDEAVRAVATSTRTHVTMHAETFHRVEERRMIKNNIVVGYYHSHPGLSVFQSGEDVYNFRTYHPEEYQIAIVADSSLTSRDKLDPTKPWIGFFAWDKSHNPVKLPPQNLFVADAASPPFSTKPQPASEGAANSPESTSFHGPV